MKVEFKNLIFILLALCLSISALEAQNNTRIDKLKATLETVSDKEKVALFNDIAFEYRMVNAYKTLAYCEKSIKLAETIDYPYELPRSYNFIGLGYYNETNYPEALKYFDKGTEKALELGDSTELGFSYQMKAHVYRWLGDLPRGLENALDSEEIFEKINDQIGMAYIYGTLSGLYLDQNEADKAFDYSSKALQVLEKEKIEKGLTKAMLAHADVLAFQKKYSEAYEYYHDALMRYQRVGHQRGILITNIRMALMYDENGNHKTAKAKLAKARQIHEKYGINTELTSLYMLEGRLNLAEYESAKAIEKLEKAESFALRQSRKKELSEIYRLLAIAYETLNEPASSLFYLKSHHSIKDSLFNVSVAKHIAKYEANSQLAKKDEKLNELQQEKASTDEQLLAERKFRIGLGLFAILLIFTVLVVWRSYRIKKKSHDLLSEKNEQINQQSEELKEQAKKLRIARNILKVSNEKLEEKVKVRTAELTRSNAELKRFAFIASHDMKEPLRTVTSFSQLLKRELAKEKVNESRVNEYLDYITRGSKNLSILVQDLLSYSKIKESPEEPLILLSIDNVINTVLSNLGHQIRTNNVTFNFVDLPSTVYGIEVMLVQLFQNLVSNAIKFRKENEPCVIEIKAREKGDYWIFSISDNGIGIDPQYHKQIFQLFRKLHSSMQYEGSGIGLSICKRVIELHGGDVWLRSAKGRGTTVYFSLPISNEKLTQNDGVKVMSENK
ncbi:MAG: ATP-binding protein [Bacteroidota bacterium]